MNRKNYSDFIEKQGWINPIEIHVSDPDNWTVVEFYPGVLFEQDSIPTGKSLYACYVTETSDSGFSHSQPRLIFTDDVNLAQYSPEKLGSLITEQDLYLFKSVTLVDCVVDR